MKGRLTDHLSLKVGAFVLALLLWLYIYNVDNPWTTRVITGIPITLTNTEVLTENNKTFNIEGSSTATVTVRVRTRDSNRLGASNFTAVVDCSKISHLNSAAKVEYTYDGIVGLNEIRYNTDTVKIISEDIRPYTYQLEVRTTGDLPLDYKLGDRYIEPASITVTAPVSTLTAIYSAGVVVDVTGCTDNVVLDDMDIILYDRLGNPRNMALGSNVSLNVTTADVVVNILKQDQMTVDLSGVMGADQVASGYRYTGLVASQETVQLAGRREVVNRMERILVPSEDLDVTGASQTIEKDIDLSAYLPDGVEIVGPSIIHVSLNIVPVEQTQLSYVTSRLKWIGADEDRFLYEMSDVQAALPLTITGFEADHVQDLKAADLELSLDVSGLTEGDYDIPVNISDLREASSGLELVSPRTIHVTILEKQAAAAESNGSGFHE